MKKNQVEHQVDVGAPLIEIAGLRKQYGKSLTPVIALDHVDLTVAGGEWVAIMGPSGSGKSTLLNILGGLDQQSAGLVRIAGTELASLSKQQLAAFRAAHVGFIFQQFHLIPYLTAVENVMLAQYFHSISDEREAREMLERVGLDARATHLPGQLSGGEQQRVAIARALINQPSLLLADEPTGNLDAENEAIVMRLLRELHGEGHTIIMVTHDPIIARSANRRIDLAHGRIEQIWDHSPTGSRFSIEQERDFDEVLEQLWVLEETDTPATLEKIHSSCGANPRSLPMMREIGLLQPIGQSQPIGHLQSAGALPEGGLVVMSEPGRARAANIIRRHRLAERLFSDTFQMHDEQQLEANACTFEHILSPEVTERICIFLNHPDRCPHGSPIPTGECCPTR
ncbi:MAG: ATP-binding cassette domain-containing protein [Acidobacteria bacterium]|nr:ATP-binding cassette domain-containing protein [Acidobacteriota bacterium]